MVRTPCHNNAYRSRRLANRIGIVRPTRSLDGIWLPGPSYKVTLTMVICHSPGRWSNDPGSAREGDRLRNPALRLGLPGMMLVLAGLCWPAVASAQFFGRGGGGIGGAGATPPGGHLPGGGGPAPGPGPFHPPAPLAPRLQTAPPLQREPYGHPS